MLRSALRIATAVVLTVVIAFAVPLGGISLWGRAFGDRVYVRNLSSCRIIVASEHDGVRIAPGDTRLIKPGWMDHTPSTLISPGEGIALSGIHFGSNGRLAVRGRPELLVPPEWIEREWFGRRLVYEVTPELALTVGAPRGSGRGSQPEGFPIQGSAAKDWKCIP